MSHWPIAPVFKSTSAAIAQTPASSAESLVQRGQQQYRAGDYATAAQLWEEAAALFGAVGDRWSQVQSLNYAAQAHQTLGNWPAAEDAIAASMALWDEDEAALLPEHLQAIGQAWTIQGSLLLEQSQHQAALAAFERAAESYRAAADETGLLRSQINQAKALQAHGFYRRAVELLESRPSLTSRSPSTLAAAGLRTLGDLKRTVGDLSTAQDLLERSLHVAEQLEEEEAIAAAQFGLANTAAASGNFDRAQALYQQVLQSGDSPSQTVKAGGAWIGLLADLEDATSIDDVLTQLTPALAQLPLSRLRTYAYIDIASALAKMPQGDYRQTAVEFLVRARQDAQALGDLPGESYALGTLGDVYFQARQLDEAQTLTENALALSETVNAAEISYKWNAQLGALQKDRGNSESAIQHYTAAFNTLQSLRTDLVAISDDVRFNFRADVEPIYRDLVDLLTALPQPRENDLQQARGAIESLQLAELENFFREACLSPSQEVDRVVDSTEQPTAVLYPIILPDRLEVILKLPQQPLTHYATPIIQTDLETRLAQLRDDLYLPYTLRAVQSEAAQLYDWLIAPIQSQLEDSQVDTLVFVLDGALRNIPMGLLYDGDRYLIEKYSVAIAPGLQLVDPKPLTERALAVVTVGLSEARHGFSPLPFVETEVNRVKELFSSQVLFNQAFTEISLEETIQASPFPVVHLATHGQFSSNPEETFILAWDKPIQLQNLNDILRNSEQSRESAIELLVLSACETAAGDRRATLGLAGVAVRAGARSTLASLWSLDDETTAIFMDKFYAALSAPGINRAQAVRSAQTELLSNPRYEHPRYWAPYVLVGNWL
ncbi:MAG: CHAT domain-containing protein [Cyanobacteria bacterium P01_D01_bin.123]